MEFSNSKHKQNKSLQQFSEVDEDLRRIAEREANKQLCPFGDNCYRKNPKHFEEFRHKSNNNNGINSQKINKTDEKKVKITDFFKRKPIGIKKLSLEKPNDESDYEIEDSEEDNCDVNKVSNNELNNSLLSETPSKKRKFSTFNKKNTRKKSFSNQKKTMNRMKNKSDDKIEYFESDEECDEDFKSLLREDNDRQTKYKKSPILKKEMRNSIKKKNQTPSPYLKKLEFKPNEETIPKNQIINKSPIVSNQSEEGSKAAETIETSFRELKPKISSKQLNELIKEIFLFEMPEDFFHLWRFCKSLKPEKPEDAFVEELGFRLVGPYDILTGKVKKSLIRDSDAILCHWRYFYDLPEFQTIIASIRSGYHLGYFRDTPDEENPVIVANNSEKSCIIEGIADNIFAALYSEIRRRKTVENRSLSQIEPKLKEFCARNQINLNANTKLRSRKSKINALTFNNFGFIVPVSNTDVGYRPLPLTDPNLKKLLTRICKVDIEERISCNSLKELQEIIQLINYANDECDFGMGLELGIDLFCFGDHYFHKSVLFLLPLAYHLLNRETFGRIIRAHIKNRRKGFQLDSI